MDNDLLFNKKAGPSCFGSDLNEDDLESFNDYTEYFQIDDISENEDGEPMELNFE